MVRVPGQPLFVKDLNCHCLTPYTDQFLSPFAWSNVTNNGLPDYSVDSKGVGQPGTSANGVFGTSTFYSDFRGQRKPIESFNIGRNFRIKERMNFQIRAEFTNILNRTFIGNQNTSSNPRILPGAPKGQITSGFGTVNATAAVNGFPTLGGNASLPRTGTLIGRFTF